VAPIAIGYKAWWALKLVVEKRTCLTYTYTLMYLKVKQTRDKFPILQAKN
jgi:hypothetical protein